MTGQETRRERWRLHAVEGLAVASWVGLGYVVVEVGPESLGSQVAFFFALWLALAATLGLLAYQLSFALFADPSYRGNLGRSVRQGVVAASVLTAAAILQVARLLSPAAGGALAVVLLAGQSVVLLRE